MKRLCGIRKNNDALTLINQLNITSNILLKKHIYLDLNPQTLKIITNIHNKNVILSTR